MARSDKQRWNERFVNFPMPSHPSKIVIDNLKHVQGKKVLDIACGTGRNSHYLLELGFDIDAVDLSDYALNALHGNSRLTKIEADLDTYAIQKERYDLMLNINFLGRHLFEGMIHGLKQDGVLIFETFIIAHGEAYTQPSNPDYLLRHNELLEAFKTLETLFYEERDDTNLRGEKVKIASYVGRKL
ncbi:MAG: methyltransferase domain-containing protein [Campylobacterota bacterium]|nr:methyltransferase domain-containing protein [Campylobacterota bacterium]